MSVALCNALKVSDRIDQLQISWENMSLYCIGVLLQAASRGKREVCMPRELNLMQTVEKFPPTDLHVEKFAEGLHYNCSALPEDLQIESILIDWSSLPLKGLGRVLKTDLLRECILIASGSIVRIDCPMKKKSSASLREPPPRTLHVLGALLVLNSSFILFC